MILIPKYFDIEIPKPVPMQYGLRGEFKITMRDANGRFLYETDWIKNLITNQGLDHIGGSGFTTKAYVGSGNTPPAVTDVQLDNLLGESSGFYGGTSGTGQGNSGAPDYEFWTKSGYRFGTGVGTGTIAEIGLGPSGSPTSLGTRALVTPTVVKNADQIMDLTYKLIGRMTLTDVTGVVTITGENYDFTARPYRAEQTGAYMDRATLGGLHVSSAPLQAITGVGPPDTGFDYSKFGNPPGGITIQPYTPGSYTRRTDFWFSITMANLSGGEINTCWFNGNWQNQYGFGPGANVYSPGFQVEYVKQVGGGGILKNSDQTFSIGASVSWARI